MTDALLQPGLQTIRRSTTQPDSVFPMYDLTCNTDLEAWVMVVSPSGLLLVIGAMTLAWQVRLVRLVCLVGSLLRLLMIRSVWRECRIVRG